MREVNAVVEGVREVNAVVEDVKEVNAVVEGVSTGRLRRGSCPLRQ